MKEEFVVTRKPAAEPFVCGRCTEAKKAKVSVLWTDENGVKKTICNGCYGNLLSRKK